MAETTLPPEIDCKKILFTNDTELNDFFQNTLYGFIAPAVILSVILSFLVVRKHLCGTVLWGRPGIPEPVRLLEEQTNRGTFVAAFILCAWMLVDVVMGENPFDWEYPKFLNTLIMLFLCLLLALLFYPIFGGTSSHNAVGLILATLFTWCWTALLIIKNQPCQYVSSERWIIYVCKVLPALIAALYLSIILPYRAGVILFCKHKATGSFLADNRKMYQVMHVKNIFSKKCDNRQDVLKILKSRLYRSIHGFRYSLTILVAVSISIFICYTLAVGLMESYYIMMTVLTPILTSNELWTEVLNDSFTRGDELIDLVDKFAREALYWARSFEAILLVAVAVSFLATGSSLLFTLQNYRKHLMYMYRGIYKTIPRYKASKGPRGIVLASAKYIGFQMGYAAWGFLIQSAVVIVIMLVFFIIISLILRYGQESVLFWLLDTIVPPIVILILILGIQHLLVQLFFLLKDGEGNKVLGIDNRRAFSNFQYFMVFVNAPLGIIACLKRIGMAVIFGVWTLPRLDVSTLSRQFERFDNGFSAYVSLLYLENAQTNPILLVFANLLWETNLWNKVPQHSVAPFNGKVGKAKNKLVRNRWHLFYTLHNNPRLRQQRQAKLDEEQILESQKQKPDLELRHRKSQHEEKKRSSVLVAEGSELSIKVHSTPF